jgi:pectinesterase
MLSPNLFSSYPGLGSIAAALARFVAWLAVLLPAASLHAATGVTPAPGMVYSLVVSASNMCMDVTSGSTSEGAVLQQWGCSGAKWQQFRLVPVSTGRYQLVNLNSGLCVEVPNSRTTSGVQLRQWSCGNAANNQLWTPSASGSTTYQLKNVHSGLCISDRNSSMLSGSAVVQEACTASSNKQWAFRIAAPASSARQIVVAADGSGDVTSVQAAVDSVQAYNTTPTTIRIHKGIYTEKVLVPANKPDITLVGATGTASDVVLTESRPANVHGTQGSATVVILAPRTTLMSLTIRNNYDEAANGSSQALALYASGDRAVYGNVRLLANQDTFLAASPSGGPQSRQYFYSSYIEGDVDFIYGPGAVVFNGCQIHSLSRGSTSNNGYITAASTHISNPYGFLFIDSIFTSNARANTVYLGRPWHPSGNPDADGQVLIRSSALGAHVKVSQPWSDMSGFSWRTEARFAEYQNTGPGATLNANRPQLSASSAARYTIAAYLSGADGWNPLQ